MFDLQNLKLYRITMVSITTIILILFYIDKYVSILLLIPVTMNFGMKIFNHYNEKRDAAEELTSSGLYGSIFSALLTIFITSITLHLSWKYYISNIQFIYLVIVLGVLVTSVILDKLVLITKFSDTTKGDEQGRFYTGSSKLYYGEEIDLEKYLNSDEYLELEEWGECHWNVYDTVELIQDSSGCYWSSSTQQSNNNGNDLDYVAIFIINNEDAFLVNIDYYSIDFDGRTGDYVNYWHVSYSQPKMLNPSSGIKKIIDKFGLLEKHELINDCLESPEYAVELFHSACPTEDLDYALKILKEVDIEFKCITPGFEHITNDGYGNEIMLFKHEHQLLDSRNLSGDCWFKTYHVTPLQDDDEQPGIELYQVEGMPYLWWVTELLPPKDGCTAFRDVYGNCFYVGEEKNIGVCHIHNGVDVSDNPVIIEIDWDGYFKINKVDK